MVMIGRLRRKWSCSMLQYYCSTACAWRSWGKPWDAAVLMAGLRANVWTQDFHYIKA